MSFFLVAPEALTAAASHVAGIGSDITAANAAAVLPTTGVAAAAGDAVSAQVAALFSAYGQGYQQISAQLSSFHDQIARTLTGSANAYAATEAGAAQTLASAVNAPAAALLGEPLASPSGLISDAVNQVKSAFSGATASVSENVAAVGSALGLTPTGGTGAVAATSALLGPVAEAAPAAVIPVSWATAIENAYLAFEPWVEYGFLLASYAAGWLPYVGLLAPQIMFFYNLFEPMVQSGLFNILDWLSGTISFSQGVSNFWSTTTASINFFIQTEINWVRSFFPPLPPFPPYWY